jgi:hypothetical protein
MRSTWYPRSNLGPWSHDGRLRALHDGQRRCSLCSRRQLTGARCPRCSGAQFLIGFCPTTLWRRGEIVLLNFKQRRAMVAASDGGLSPFSLSSGDWLLWSLSNDREGTEGSGGPRGSFHDGWLSKGGSTPAWRRGRAAAMAFPSFCKNIAWRLAYL